jgi:hypothetical protein
VALQIFSDVAFRTASYGRGGFVLKGPVPLRRIVYERENPFLTKSMGGLLLFGFFLLIIGGTGSISLAYELIDDIIGYTFKSSGGAVPWDI